MGKGSWDSDEIWMKLGASMRYAWVLGRMGIWELEYGDTGCSDGKLVSREHKRPRTAKKLGICCQIDNFQG
jgi:hypothetical protein